MPPTQRASGRCACQSRSPPSSARPVGVNRSIRRCQATRRVAALTATGGRGASIRSRTTDQKKRSPMKGSGSRLSWASAKSWPAVRGPLANAASAWRSVNDRPSVVHGNSCRCRCRAALRKGSSTQVGLQQGLERLGRHGAQGRPGARAERELPAADALALGPQRGELRRRELAEAGEALDAAEAVDADQLDLGQGLAQREARQHAHEGRLVVEIVLQPQHDVAIVGGRPRQPPVGLAQFGTHLLARQAGAFGNQRRTAGQPGVEGGRRAEPRRIGERQIVALDARLDELVADVVAAPDVKELLRTLHDGSIAPLRSTIMRYWSGWRWIAKLKVVRL